MTVNDMKRCIDEAIVLGNEVRARNDLDQRAVANPGATADALTGFAQRFGDSASPSLLQLLSIYNGVACFDYVDVELFGVAYLTEHSAEVRLTT